MLLPRLSRSTYQSMPFCALLAYTLCAAALCMCVSDYRYCESGSRVEMEVAALDTQKSGILETVEFICMLRTTLVSAFDPTS